MFFLISNENDCNHAITIGSFLIGRESSICEFSSPFLQSNFEVSRKHAKIISRSKKNKTYVLICDMGSTNGTFVNGKKVNTPRRLKNGDLLQLGDPCSPHTASFTFVPKSHLKNYQTLQLSATLKRSINFSPFDFKSYYN